MPTVRTQNNSVLLKNNLVSCECCVADGAIGCSATTMSEFAEVVITITRAQALALKSTFGIRAAVAMEWSAWSVTYGSLPFPRTITCPAYTDSKTVQRQFNSVCDVGMGFGQGFAGGYATGSSAFGSSSRDVLSGITLAFYLRQLGTSLNNYQLGFLWGAEMDVEYEGFTARVGTGQVGTSELAGTSVFQGSCLGSSFSHSKPYYMNMHFNPAPILSFSTSYLRALSVSITTSPP